jgi:hypothetical protein
MSFALTIDIVTAYARSTAAKYRHYIDLQLREMDELYLARARLAIVRTRQ